MTERVLLRALILVTVFATMGNAEESPRVEEPKPLTELSGKDAICLAEACKITTLINDEKWEALEKTFGTKETWLTVIKTQSRVKDWEGVGAFRGARLDKTLPRIVTFRFGLGSRTSVHEIWISFKDGNPLNPGLMVLGW